MPAINPGFVLIDSKWVIEKDSTAELDYYWHLASLIPTGDSIASISVAVTGGLVVMSSDFDSLTSIVTVWLKAGSKSRNYASCTVTYTTVGGRKDDRTAYFKIVEK